MESDLDILSFVQNDIALNGGGLVLSHLLCIELSTSRKRHLSSRLLFSKTDRPKSISKEEWKAHMVQTLRKTYQSNAWFARARALDWKRGTALGTLRYLPPEVREEIWDFTLLSIWNLDRVIVDYQHEPLTTSSSVSLVGCGPKCIEFWQRNLETYQGQTRNPHFFHIFQAIFGSALTDCLSIFFRRNRFHFSHLYYLNKFLSVFPWEQMSALSATVVESDFLHNDFENFYCCSTEDDPQWQYTAEHLPSYCILNVVFGFDKTSSLPLSSTGLKRILKCIGGLNKKVTRSFPKAVTSISFPEVEDPSDQLIQDQRSALIAVVQEVEK